MKPTRLTKKKDEKQRKGKSEKGRVKCENEINETKLTDSVKSTRGEDSGGSYGERSGQRWWR